MDDDDKVKLLQTDIDRTYREAFDAVMRDAAARVYAMYPAATPGSDAQIILDVLMLDAMHYRLSLCIGSVETLMLHRQNVTADELKTRRDVAMAQGAEAAGQSIHQNTH